MKDKPDPINTADVVLPPAVDEIAELLSRNVHEVWASQKFQDGFSYGATDDKDQKTHHNLVPYDQLSEADRQYDRKTTLETIKVLIKLGFTLEKQLCPHTSAAY